MPDGTAFETGPYTEFETGPYFVGVGAQQGWQCPVCHAVNSPWLQQCPCKGRVDYTTTVNAPFQWHQCQNCGQWLNVMDEHVCTATIGTTRTNDEG